MKTVKKAIASAVGGLAAVVAAGLIHGNALVAAVAVIGAATTYGVYKAKNATSE